ncbi:MAG: Doxorubicin resistance ATP-binding protein DrrA [Alphaproteobacteria bacterium MarineAlpha9_Bin4]|nr:MAG: Doxorubicin resistance ATP-binding protein DrrA [Alphaproteobacteria bacterium MarineAlpha9_Bin4]|tara:strand:+ start:100 stop:1050 length:951 start_codon:yes stop_codon:yes gene_type:complete
MFKKKILRVNSKALQIEKLTKNYTVNNKNQASNALDNVSFSIEKGSMIALLGPNGAGKSTLINILSGITNKSSGKASINGFDIDNNINEAKLSIGVVPQELVMDPYFTPRETLNFQSGYYGIKKKDYITEELLYKLNLLEKADSYVRFLSGGMKRRLMIAKAMVHSPPILILDEPTAGVDVNLRQRLWDSIKELNRKGTTILLTTHYLEEAESLCKEVIMIDKGKIIIKGEIKKLLENIDLKSISIFIENEIKQLPKDLKKLGVLLKNKKCLTLDYKPSDTSIEKILNIILRNNIQIKDIVTSEPSLEDLFNNLVN